MKNKALWILILLLFVLTTPACNNMANQAPSAQAGSDQTAVVGETVNLDGSDSLDPEGNKLFADWDFLEVPEGSQVASQTPNNLKSSFVPDVPGAYVAQLRVDDGAFSDNSIATDEVQVNAVIPLSFSGIAIDYDPEVRCSDNNWSTNTPVACSPQLSFTCAPPPPENLAGCPDQCQSCFDTDLAFLKSNLGVTTITVYQPNYFIMVAAQKFGIKVLFGLFNDTVLALATPDSGTTSCTFAGAPALCGQSAVDSMINGACGATTPWPTANFCTGSSYISAFKPFFDDGTIVGVQLGNEILTSPINSGGQVLTPAQVLAAAKTLRNGLNGYSYTKTPIVVSFVAGTEQNLCVNGAPPPNVDGIAGHPYCNNVANVPPLWPFETGNTPAQAGQDCANQVLQIFNSTAVAACGQAQSFIGETGYNTGCPGYADEANHLSTAESFFPDMVTLACQSNIPLFFFDYADACPAGGCLPGCPGGPNVGNGYFGIYYTENYLTTGNLVLKFPTVPSLSCP